MTFTPIDRETWDMAQKELSQRHRPTRTGEMGLFSGLVFCADCRYKEIPITKFGRSNYPHD